MLGNMAFLETGSDGNPAGVLRHLTAISTVNPSSGKGQNRT
jgi:hypothetical protein